MFESPRTIVARLIPLLLLVGLILGGWSLLEAALFRSGLYYRYVASPDSTAGATERALLVIRERYRPGARNVLVMGDSRTAEGFSAKLANGAGGDINFIQAGIPGTTPRVWYHLLREVDPDDDRFAAIVLVGIYDATLTNREDLSNRTLDLNYLQPLLRLADVLVLPPSFPDPQARDQAWRALLLPLQAARKDLRELTVAPCARIRLVRDNVAAYVISVDNYPGRPESLAGVMLDASTLQPTRAGGFPANLHAYLKELRASRTHARPLRQDNQRYYEYWIGRIASRYQANARPVFLFALPRGPFHRDFGPPQQPSLASIGLSPRTGIALLAPSGIVALERPEYFFDGLHLNAAGRDHYSPLLARTVTEALASRHASGVAP